MRWLLALALVAVTALPASALGVGDAPPELDGTPKWINHSGTTIAELRGRVVLVEIFRTW